MSHIQIRISEEEKKAVQEAFKKMGMTMSSGIKIFLHRVAAEKKMPFEILMTTLPKVKKEIKKKCEVIQKKCENKNLKSSENFKKWNLLEKHKIG
ncbi:type II toxin-antitoxin system RelB/DinJ family antitoxin [Candidatus Gracilibacteria bacterium]|nr:type II toxin-antitoxin system RelB/DinJ family antitoxin [Candidatus Gracilibacteria bacterium]